MGLGNFLKSAGKSIKKGAKSVGKVLENPALAVAKGVINTVNAIKDYAHAEKIKREERYRKDYQHLEERLNKNKNDVKNMSALCSQAFAKRWGNETVDIESASANEIRRISNELHDMQELFIEKAESIENDILSYIQSAVNETIQEFEGINNQDFAGATLNLNIGYLKSSVSDMESMVKGSIKNAVRRNLSIDSQECKEIFMKNALEKQKAMENLQLKIYKNSVNSLWTIINDTISIQNQGIFKQIENRLDAIELNVNESIRQLAEIEATKQLGENEVRQKQAEFQNMIDISSWCLEQLNQEVQI